MSRFPVIRSVPLSRLVLVAVVTLLLATFALLAAVGEVLGRTNPVLVERIGIGNRAQAHLNVTMLMSAADQTRALDARLIPAAKDAIAAQPLNPQALSAIATKEFQDGDKEASLRVAKLGEKLSRRSLGTQILLFQDALMKNRLSEAFQHLDIAMRTAGERRTMLFPATTAGLQIPEFRAGLAPIMDQRDDWVSPFLIYAVDEGGAANGVAELFRTLQPRTRSFLAPTLAARTITRLTEAGQLDLARQMLASLPGKDLNLLSNPAMNEDTFDPEIGNLGWMLEEGPSLTARAAAGEKRGSRAVLIDIGPGDSSLALSRLLFMPPGTYAFSAAQRTDGSESEISSEWVLHCLGASAPRPIWRSSDGRAISIPAACPAQLIQLIVTQESSSAGYTQLFIEDVALARR